MICTDEEKRAAILNRHAQEKSRQPDYDFYVEATGERCRDGRPKTVAVGTKVMWTDDFIARL